MTDAKYTDYVASDAWKCDKSPTGAHHWLEKDVDGKRIFYCKWCFDVKNFPYTFEEATGGRRYAIKLAPTSDYEITPPFKSHRRKT